MTGQDVKTLISGAYENENLKKMLNVSTSDDLRALTAMLEKEMGTGGSHFFFLPIAPIPEIGRFIYMFVSWLELQYGGTG